jgi:hypothetical protein
MGSQTTKPDNNPKNKIVHVYIQVQLFLTCPPWEEQEVIL